MFENLKVIPPAFLVPINGVEFIQKEEQRLARVKDTKFDPQRSIVIDGPVFSLGPATSGAGAHEPGAVKIVRQGLNNFQAEVNTLEDSIFVISQVHYPGWKAYVDGQASPVLEADYALSGIRLAPGKHIVRFSFEPATFWIGLFISTLTAGVVAVFSLRSWLRGTPPNLSA